MGVKSKPKSPDIIFRDGKPSAVVLDIDDYQELLERLEDAEDLKMLQDIASLFGNEVDA